MPLGLITHHAIAQTRPTGISIAKNRPFCRRESGPAGAIPSDRDAPADTFSRGCAERLLHPRMSRPAPHRFRDFSQMTSYPRLTNPLRVQVPSHRRRHGSCLAARIAYRRCSRMANRLQEDILRWSDRTSDTPLAPKASTCRQLSGGWWGCIR